jgi:hypothetical protein
VTPQNFVRGATVTRGPDWTNGDTDGGKPMTLLRMDRDGDCCIARRADGTAAGFRAGYQDHYDLIYGETPAPPLEVACSAADQARLDGQIVTLALVTRGALVSRGPQWPVNKNVDGGKPGRLTGVIAKGIHAEVQWEDGSLTFISVTGGDDAFLVFGVKPAKPAPRSRGASPVLVWGGICVAAVGVFVASALLARRLKK